ncbi:wnt and FGF inhibitory regulator domain-containing protein [Purpureocillium lavendulum]|uniref:Wnt and FGF inhibitory regulator domain-containing protein n=1 Tax=Purpureocillium lavendulum TaxID=1247861 RepID=A0AB34FKB5_9HYPO|nr:wnt and FGF inhibitory regulator domain-containing protein [Purpureocillium lavendulum]
MKASQLMAALATLATTADARLVARVPKVTQSVALPSDGISPRPTAPPSMHELLRRAESSSYKLTMAVAPDNTCGYISANVSWAYTCGPQATCGLVMSQPTHSGLVMCYNEGGSNFRFGCMDYNDIFSSNKCDDTCDKDTLVLKCTNTLSKFCNTIAFPGGITDYWCAAISDSAVNRAFTTYKGQTVTRSYFTITQTGSSTSLLNTKQTGNSDIGAPTPSGTPTQSSSAAASSTSGSASDDNSNEGSGGGKKKTPVGAIVGGVVGGVAAIGVAGIVAFLCLRRNKKQADAGKATGPSADNSPVQQPGVPQSMVQQQPGQHQSYYNPNYTPVQGYPSPNQQYPHTTPPPPGAYYPVADPSQHPTSPSGSHMTDPRTNSTSPGVPQWGPGGYPAPAPAPGHHQPPAGFQPQQPVIHEAPNQPSDNHRGEMHELS